MYAQVYTSIVHVYVRTVQEVGLDRVYTKRVQYSVVAHPYTRTVQQLGVPVRTVDYSIQVRVLQFNAAHVHVRAVQYM